MKITCNIIAWIDIDTKLHKWASATTILQTTIDKFEVLCMSKWTQTTNKFEELWEQQVNNISDITDASAATEYTNN